VSNPAKTAPSSQPRDGAGEIAPAIDAGGAPDEPLSRQLSSAVSQLDEAQKLLQGQLAACVERAMELSARGEALNQREAKLREEQEVLTALETELRAARQELDASRAVLDQSKAELEQRRRQLETDASDLDQRRGHFAVECSGLEARRDELLKQSQDLEEQRRQCAAASAENERHSGVLAARTAELERREREADELRRRVQADAEAQQGRADELRAMSEALEQRETAIAERERAMAAREEAMSRFQDALSRITSALGAGLPDDALAIAEAGDSEASERAERHARAPDDHSRASADPRSTGEPGSGEPAKLPGRPASVQPLSSDATAPPSGRAEAARVPESAESAKLQGKTATPPVRSSAEAPHTPDRPGAATEKPPGAPTTTEDGIALLGDGRVDESRLAPEELRKLRMLRRMSGGRTPDVELLRRVRREAGENALKPGGAKPKKRSWWGS
jgi:hypothetical protein